MPSAPLIPEEHLRYRVQHRHTIERILGDLVESRAIVSLYGRSDTEFMLSSLVALDSDRGLVQFEQGKDAALNQQLLKLGEVRCLSTHDQVQVQFTCRDLRAVQDGGKPLFEAPMPSELLRLQRRESYRLATSVVNPVKCLVNTGHTFLEAVVIDISIGGVGILAYEGAGLLKTGQTYHGCRIDLPGTGTFAVSLNVCTTFDVELKNSRLTHRAGCQFIDLPPSVETEIQRYIIRVERERRARYT